jgi:predicted ATPase
MIFRLFLLCTLVFFASCASSRSDTDKYNAALEDSLFLDKAPVGNLGYQFFLYCLQY